MPARLGLHPLTWAATGLLLSTGLLFQFQDDLLLQGPAHPFGHFIKWTPLPWWAQDPEGFIGEGGWDFLDAEADSDAEGEDEGAPVCREHTADGASIMCSSQSTGSCWRTASSSLCFSCCAVWLPHEACIQDCYRLDEYRWKTSKVQQSLQRRSLTSVSGNISRF